MVQFHTQHVIDVLYYVYIVEYEIITLMLYCFSWCLLGYMSTIICGKNGFAKVLNNLARYRSENNCVGSLK